MERKSAKRKALYRKFLVGYLCLLAVPLMILGISVSKGAGAAGLVPGIPVYLLVLGGATYQFVKELRALKREEQEATSKESEQ
ncbi:hypothetical protein [Caballeronia sp. Lep1P3]|uniref:hypothetical protein n=1 Tax=Caballeronia sp. Lep1P3 TaxID=2878150 RepID=UPI001FD377D2|nr:hypothetical protein [Caballeronia sp. Lep1P3]